METESEPSYRPPYALIGLSIAIAFWVFDSSVHFIFYGEPEFEFIPSGFNELWMRSTIFLLIIAMGIYAEFSVKRLMEAEKIQLQLQIKYNESLQNEIRLQQQQIDLTKETVLQMHNIINNFLQNLQLFEIEARERNSISDESLQLFNRIIQETAESVREIGEQAVKKSSTPLEDRIN